MLWINLSIGKNGQSHPGKVNSEDGHFQNLASQISQGSFYLHSAARSK